MRKSHETQQKPTIKSFVRKTKGQDVIRPAEKTHEEERECTWDLPFKDYPTHAHMGPHGYSTHVHRLHGHAVHNLCDHAVHGLHRTCDPEMSRRK